MATVTHMNIVKLGLLNICATCSTSITKFDDYWCTIYNPLLHFPKIYFEFHNIQAYIPQEKPRTLVAYT